VGPQRREEGREPRSALQATPHERRERRFATPDRLREPGETSLEPPRGALGVSQDAEAAPSVSLRATIDARVVRIASPMSRCATLVKASAALGTTWHRSITSREAPSSPCAALGTSCASLALPRAALGAPREALGAPCDAPREISASISVNGASLGTSRAALGVRAGALPEACASLVATGVSLDASCEAPLEPRAELRKRSGAHAEASAARGTPWAARGTPWGPRGTR
jgi:hypothetical protein